MGFSFFHTRRAKTAKPAETVRQAEDAAEMEAVPAQAQTEGYRTKTAPIGELFEGMFLEVTLPDGERLLSGQVTQHTQNSLTLSRPTGTVSFKTAAYGSTVTVSGYDRRKVPVLLSGTVEESSRVMLRVNNLHTSRQAELRGSFRLPISAPVCLYSQNDLHMQRPEDCTLVNISVGGCCVQSEFIHIENEVVRMRVKLGNYAPINLLGEIVRCTTRTDGSYWYGIIFAKLSEQEENNLAKTLYNLQMGLTDVHTRHPGGHW